MKSIQSVCCAIVYLAGCTAAVAQQAALPAPGTGASPQSVVLDVVVTPQQGATASQLGPQDFSVTDNKVPQAVQSFREVESSASPVQVVLVVDAINTGYTQIAYERTQIERFLRANDGKLTNPVLLAFATDKGVQMQKAPTLDGNALAGELDKSTIALRGVGRSAGFRGAEERFNISVSALRQISASVSSRPGRKVIVWISPGWPLLPGTKAELTQRDRQTLFTQIVQMSTLLRQSRITLYSVDAIDREDVSSTFYYQAFDRGVTKPSDAQIANLGLQVLAVQSGGLVLNSSNNLESMLQTCLNDTRHYYEISFAIPPAQQSYHQLQVTLDKPGLVARTRESYYALP